MLNTASTTLITASHPSGRGSEVTAPGTFDDDSYQPEHTAEDQAHGRAHAGDDELGAGRPGVSFDARHPAHPCTT